MCVASLREILGIRSMDPGLACRAQLKNGLGQGLEAKDVQVLVNGTFLILPSPSESESSDEEGSSRRVPVVDVTPEPNTYWVYWKALIVNELTHVSREEAESAFYTYVRRSMRACEFVTDGTCRSRQRPVVSDSS